MKRASSFGGGEGGAEGSRNRDVDSEGSFGRDEILRRIFRTNFFHPLVSSLEFLSSFRRVGNPMTLEVFEKLPNEDGEKFLVGYSKSGKIFLIVTEEG